MQPRLASGSQLESRRCAARSSAASSTLHYQPIVDARDGDVVGVEALLRWTHPDARRSSRPDDVHPAGRGDGLIVAARALGPRARRAARPRLARARPDRSLLAIARQPVGRQLAEPDFVRRASRRSLRGTAPARAARARDHRERPDRGPTRPASRLDGAARTLGVRIAIDDFGTGYSSLAYLRRFPVDVLKIDRTFTEDVDRAESASAIVGAILSMGRAVGLDVVVEGIERETQLAALRELGATAAQGYLLSRPCPVEDIRALIAASSVRVEEAA